MPKRIILFSLIFLIAASCSNQNTQQETTKPEAIIKNDVFENITSVIIDEVCRPEWKYKNCQNIRVLGVFNRFEPMMWESKSEYLNGSWKINLSNEILESEQILVTELIQKHLANKIAQVINASNVDKINGTDILFYVSGNQFLPKFSSFQYANTVNTNNWRVCINEYDGYSLLLPPGFEPETESNSHYEESLRISCPIKYQRVANYKDNKLTSVFETKAIISITVKRDKKYSSLDTYVFSEVTNKKNELEEFTLGREKAYWYTAPDGFNEPVVITLISGKPVIISRNEAISDGEFNSIIQNFRSI